jgi:hypothetical protein
MIDSIRQVSYPAPTKITPRTQDLKVLEGMLGSSWLSTTARTSA